MLLRHFAVSNLIPDGYTSNLIRYPVSSVLYLPLLVLAVRRGGLGRFWVAALLPAVVNIIGQTLFAWLPYYAGAGPMAFLIRVSIVWSVVGAFLVFPDERVLARSGKFWVGAALAIAGFVVLSVAGLKQREMTAGGAVLVLACAMFWGLYDVTVRRAMRNMHPLVVFAVIGNYSTLGLVALAPLGEPASVLKLSAGELWLVILSAWIGIAAAHGMYYVALQRLGVVVMALTCLVTPFISLLGGWLFLKEGFSTGQWAGGIILLAGALLAMRARQRVLRVAPPAVEVSPD